jgi:hypothetical protein
MMSIRHLLIIPAMLMLSACEPQWQATTPQAVWPVMECIDSKSIACLKQYSDDDTRLTFGDPRDRSLLEAMESPDHPAWAQLAESFTAGCDHTELFDICPAEAVWGENLGYRMMIYSQDHDNRPYIGALLAGD